MKSCVHKSMCAWHECTCLRLVVPVGALLGLLGEALALHHGHVELRVGVAHLMEGGMGWDGGGGMGDVN